MAKKPQESKLERRFSAGGVVYRTKGKGVEWIVGMATPSSDFPDETWRLPKGWIDNINEDTPGPIASGKKKATDEELKQAALREVREEVGVEVKVIKKIATERYFFGYEGKKYMKFVTFYLMEWVGNLPEGFGWETKEVVWLSYPEALKKLTIKGEKEILKKANNLLGGIVL